MTTAADEDALRAEIVAIGKSLFERGLTAGSSGNISVRLSSDTILVTPTNSSLGDLKPERLAMVDLDGRLISGDRPSKETFLHACMYRVRPEAKAVVHTHSTYAVAVSLLAGASVEDVLPPLTAYYVMRVGRLPLVPYFPPGDDALALAVKARAETRHAMLLANHGPLVAGASLREAQYAVEEIEETAKLFLLVRGSEHRPLSQTDVLKLRAL